MTGLPVCRAAELAAVPEDRHWLIEGLWADQAVGIVGGEPKVGKSFLALDLAVAVASGAPCLRRFVVARTGPVLLFAAEDALPLVRRRLEGIAAAAQVSFAALEVYVVTAPTLRLDLPTDRSSLRESVAALRPRLLVLDPFARLHRVDENAAAEVAPMLTYLRGLQRRFHTAVVLVHHSRKGAAHTRAGQALRGSSEIHAWGDSNLYLRRSKNTLELSIEHRAAACPEDIPLELREGPESLALHIVGHGEAAASATPPDPLHRLLQVLATTSAPLSRAELRRACGIRNATVSDLLATLTHAGRITKSDRGYQLAPS